MVDAFGLLAISVSVFVGLCYGDTEQCVMPDRLRASGSVYRHPATATSEGWAPRDRQRLVGLFPIHRDDCQTVLTAKNYNGFQRAEAMRFALDLVNAQVREGKRKVALDGYILDSCSNGISAIDATLRAIWDASPISGLVGASYSGVSIPVSSVLQAYNVSMLSYASTAIQLSDKKSHPLFARLVPSDVGQARVVYDLAIKLGWKTVELMTLSGSDYSKSLKDEFVRIAEEEGRSKLFACQVNDNELRSGDDARTRNVVEKLMRSKVDGVVVFVNADARKSVVKAIGDVIRAMTVLKATKSDDDDHMSSPLKIISTDSWDVGSLHDEQAARYLHLHSYVVIPDSSGQPRMHEGKNITDHFRDLSPANSTWEDNPWIDEVWESLFNCSVQYDQSCRQRRLDLDAFQIDSKVDFVVDSVLLFSEALERHLEDGRPVDVPVNSDRFFWEYIMKAEINDSGRYVKIDCHGNRVGYYGVYWWNYNDMQYQQIGAWSEQRGKGKELEIEPKKLLPQANSTDCRPICQPGYYEDFHDKNSKCCYNCERLGRREIRKDFGNFEDCDDGWWPDKETNYSECKELEVETLDPSRAWSVFALFMAYLGLLLGLAFLAFSVRHFDHVVMRNSSRELSALTWVGVMICHLNALLVFHAEPTVAMCGLIRFTMTTGYTFILSSLYLKTNRLFRIFYAQFKQSSGVLGKLKYTSPKFQVLFCLGLVSIQMVFVSAWLSGDSPAPIPVYPAGRHVRLCQLQPVHLLFAQSFNIVLCIVTTAYSFLTRRVPANFNESRFINLSMYSVCVAWVVEGIGWIFREDLSNKESVLLYNPERSWAISTSAKTIMATLVLVFLFTHRVYKIIWEKSRESAKDDGPTIIKMGDQSAAGAGSRAENSTASTADNDAK